MAYTGRFKPPNKEKPTSGPGSPGYKKRKKQAEKNKARNASPLSYGSGGRNATQNMGKGRAIANSPGCKTKTKVGVNKKKCKK